ncbi:hypothetical protein BH09PAT2_BH09PAT2_09240 [soil metagenome]
MKNIFKLLTVGSPTINILITLALFFFSFGQLARISLPGNAIYVYLYEVFMYISFFALFLKLGIKPLRQYHTLHKSVRCFFLWVLATTIFSFFYYNADQNAVAALYLFRLNTYLLLFFYFNSYIYAFPEVKKGFQGVVFIMAIGVIATSLVQYFFYQDLGNIAYLGWDPHQYRLVGLFFDPPLTVSILVLFLLFFFLQAYEKKKIVYLAVSAIFCVLVFLTYSRGGYLALAAVAFFYMFRRLTFAKIGIIILGIVIVLILLPKGGNESLNLFRTTSIFTRTQDDAIAIDIWKKSPITGIGYNHIRYEKDKYLAEPIMEEFNPSHASASFHSSFLMILVTSGIVGLALFIWMLYQFGRENEFAKYSIIFLSVLSLTDNVLLHPLVLFLLFILVPLYSFIRPSAT